MRPPDEFPQPDGLPHELVDRLLSGEATEADYDRLAVWADAHGDEHILARFLAAASSRKTITPPVDLDRGWAKVVQQMHVGAHKKRGIFSVPSLRQGLIGAALAMSAIAVTHVRWNQHSSPPQRELEDRIYTTAAKQHATVRLTDGSSVTLAPRSRLIVPSDFGTRSRRLTLEGQGYFDVPAHGLATNRTTPFLVTSGSVTTRVLGTAFDVRHYTGDADVRVAVVRGKVTVAGRRNGVTLVSGTVGHVTDSTAMSRTEDVETYTAWTDGRLVFRDAPVQTLLASMERWYGYEFRLADSTLARKYVTVTLDVTDPSGAMQLLRHILGVTLMFEGDTVTVVPRRGVRHEGPSRRLESTPWTTTSIQRGR